MAQRIGEGSAGNGRMGTSAEKKEMDEIGDYIHGNQPAKGCHSWQYLFTVNKLADRISSNLCIFTLACYFQRKTVAH
jgi:hypothetical protein